MKKIIEKFGIIFIAIIIFVTTFLIGTPLVQENVFTISIVINSLSLIYYIYNIVKKEKIVTNKLDIFLILLTLSSVIPLIFGTYASLSETIYTAIKYFAILNTYFLAKNECKKDKKNIGIIVNCIILSIIALCFIGIDEINDNKLRFFKNDLNYELVLYDEVRLSSLFSYPNTMAIVCAIGVFLALSEIIKTKKIPMKIVYILALLVMGITLILTYSRLVYMLFAFCALLYGVFYLRKYNIKEIIVRNKKKILIGLGSAILLVITYLLIGLNLSRTLVVKNEYQKILYTVDSNTEYTFKFNAKTSGMKITVTEKNDYFDNITATTEEYSNLNGEEIEFKIHTSDDTSVIYLNIENTVKDTETAISSCTLNGEKLILQYMLLPTNVVDKVQSISLNNKSAWERFAFVEDALELIKDNWLFGYGGNAWRVLQFKTQDYSYGSREVHNFIVQAFLEFGIIGFVAYILVIIWFAKKVFRNFRNNNSDIRSISIEIAIIILLLHSLLDFNLSFVYVLTILVILLGITNSDEDEIKLENKYKWILSILLIILSLTSLTISAIEKYYIDSTRYIVNGTENTRLKLFEGCYNLIPYNINLQERLYTAYETDELSNLDKLIEIKKRNIENEKYSEENLDLTNILDYALLLKKNNNLTIDEINYILKYIYDTEGTVKYDPHKVTKRWENIWELIKEIDNDDADEKLKDQLNKEIKKYSEDILDYSKCRYEIKMVGYFKMQIQTLKNRISD